MSGFNAALAPGDGRQASDETYDRSEIRELIDNWIIWRDTGEWDRLTGLWHEGGRMNTTWLSASAAQFVAGCKKMFEAGVVGLHSIGGTSIDIRGLRAVAQTRMQIAQRGRVHDVGVDVVCQGRFVDALEKRHGRWGLVLRQPVYEMDRMTLVDPAATLKLDAGLLASFPEHYRYLAYIQTQMGVTVSKGLPGTRGPEIEALKARMGRWLDGEEATCLDS